MFMCSEAHRDTLVKFLRTSHVPQEISFYRFEGVVKNIASSVSLGFSNDEIPLEGKNHKKALHISIKCMDTSLLRFLVDTSSSLNVLPKSSLSKQTIEGLVMKSSELIVRGFDDSRNTFIGEVELLIKIGPHTFLSLSLSWIFTPLIVVCLDDHGFTQPKLSHRLSTKG